MKAVAALFLVGAAPLLVAGQLAADSVPDPLQECLQSRSDCRAELLAMPAASRTVEQRCVLKATRTDEAFFMPVVTSAADSPQGPVMITSASARVPAEVRYSQCMEREVRPAADEDVSTPARRRVGPR